MGFEIYLNLVNIFLKGFFGGGQFNLGVLHQGNFVVNLRSYLCRIFLDGLSHFRGFPLNGLFQFNGFGLKGGLNAFADDGGELLIREVESKGFHSSETCDEGVVCCCDLISVYF